MVSRFVPFMHDLHATACIGGRRTLLDNISHLDDMSLHSGHNSLLKSQGQGALILYWHLEVSKVLVRLY